MKRAMAVLLVGVMTLGLAACGNGDDSESGNSSGSGSEKTYTISYNMNTGNTGDMPDYQFLGGNLAGFLNYESRLYDDITLTLNDDGTYQLTSDAYTITDGKRVEVGSSEGIGMVCILAAEGTYEDNGDGTVTTSAAEHATYELETDLYSAEIVTSANLAAVAGEDNGEYDSDDTPVILEWVPETIFTLGEDGDIVTYARADGGAAGDDAAGGAGTSASGEEAAEAETADAAELITIPSDDDATTFTLYDDGSYRFAFDSYQVEDTGTYEYDAASSALTITDANGTQTVSSLDGDNVKFHYVYSQSDQLTGDFTIAASDLSAALA